MSSATASTSKCKFYNVPACACDVKTVKPLMQLEKQNLKFRSLFPMLDFG